MSKKSLEIALLPISVSDEQSTEELFSNAVLEKLGVTEDEARQANINLARLYRTYLIEYSPYHIIRCANLEMLLDKTFHVCSIQEGDLAEEPFPVGKKNAHVWLQGRNLPLRRKWSWVFAGSGFHQGVEFALFRESQLILLGFAFSAVINLFSTIGSLSFSNTSSFFNALLAAFSDQTAMMRIMAILYASSIPGSVLIALCLLLPAILWGGIKAIYSARLAKSSIVMGCYLHFCLFKLPSLSLLHKRNYYLVESTLRIELYYVSEKGLLEKVAIRDADEFKRKLTILRAGKRDTLFLSDKQVEDLITQNGGHIPQEDWKDLQMYLTSLPQKNFWYDSLRWFLPLHPLDARINRLERLLRWFGDLSHNKKESVFSWLLMLVNRGGYTAIVALHILLRLADGISLKQWKLLTKHYIDRGTQLQFLSMKIRAFEQLDHFAVNLKTAWQRGKFCGVISTIYAHYLKWELADSNHRLIALLILLFKLGKLALHISIFRALINTLDLSQCINNTPSPSALSGTPFTGNTKGITTNTTGIYAYSTQIYSLDCFNTRLTWFNQFPNQPFTSLTQFIPYIPFGDTPYTLDLSNKGLNGTGIVTLIQSFLNNQVNLVGLLLSGNSIRTTTELHALSSVLSSKLQRLDLSGVFAENNVFPDGISVFVSTLSQLRVLNELDLDNNQLNQVAFQQIAQALAPLSQLATLRLSGNQLNNLSVLSTASLRRLQVLDCSNNPLNYTLSLPSFRQLTNVTVLDISETGLPDEVSQELASTLLQLTRLQQIWLQPTNYTNVLITTIEARNILSDIPLTPASLQAYLANPSSFPVNANNFTVIDLSRRLYGASLTTWMMLITELSQYPYGTDFALLLSHNGMNDSLLEALSPGLTQLAIENLAQLDLSSNQLTEKSLPAFVSNLTAFATTVLNPLDLSNNPINFSSPLAIDLAELIPSWLFYGPSGLALANDHIGNNVNSTFILVLANKIIEKMQGQCGLSSCLVWPTNITLNGNMIGVDGPEGANALMSLLVAFYNHDSSYYIDDNYCHDYYLSGIPENNILNNGAFYYQYSNIPPPSFILNIAGMQQLDQTVWVNAWGNATYRCIFDLFAAPALSTHCVYGQICASVSSASSRFQLPELLLYFIRFLQVPLQLFVQVRRNFLARLMAYSEVAEQQLSHDMYSEASAPISATVPVTSSLALWTRNNPAAYEENDMRCVLDPGHAQLLCFNESQQTLRLVTSRTEQSIQFMTGDDYLEAECYPTEYQGMEGKRCVGRETEFIELQAPVAENPSLLMAAGIAAAKSISCVFLPEVANITLQAVGCSEETGRIAKEEIHRVISLIGATSLLGSTANVVGSVAKYLCERFGSSAQTTDAVGAAARVTAIVVGSILQNPAEVATIAVTTVASFGASFMASKFMSAVNFWARGRLERRDSRVIAVPAITLQ